METAKFCLKKKGNAFGLEGLMGADSFRWNRSSEEEELYVKLYENSKTLFNEFFFIR